MSKELEIIDRFDQAVRQHAWKGSLPPEEHEEIDKQYEAARRGLVNALSKRENLYDRIATATGVDRESVKKVAHALAYSG